MSYNRSYWKNIVLTFIVVIIILSAFISYKIIRNTHSSNNVNYHTSIKEISNNDSPKFSSKYNNKGYGIWLEDNNSNPINGHTLNFDKEKNFVYNIKFVNNSGYDNTFMLIIYLNNLQKEFNIVGHKETVKKYEFKLKSANEIEIPVSFSLDELSNVNNSLVISVISGSNKSSYDLEEISDFYGTNIRYNLIMQNNKKVNETLAAVGNENEYTVIHTKDFSGILLNQDIGKINRFLIPKKAIYAKPGDRITFLLRAGGHPSVEDYVSWVTIDWEQQYLDSKDQKKFLSFHLPKGSSMYKEVILTAPLQEGKYEVCAFLNANPWDNVDGKIDTGFDTAHRFSLVVE